eukprot:588753-Prorocentrum_minimum.AAC.1
MWSHIVSLHGAALHPECGASAQGVPERERALYPPSSHSLGFGPVARVAELLRPAAAAKLVG